MHNSWPIRSALAHDMCGTYRSSGTMHRWFFLSHWKWEGKFLLFLCSSSSTSGSGGVRGLEVLALSSALAFNDSSNSKAGPKFPIMEPSGVSRVDVGTTLRLMWRVGRAWSTVGSKPESCDRHLLRFDGSRGRDRRSTILTSCSPWIDLGYLLRVRSPSIGATCSATTINLAMIRHARSRTFCEHDRLKLKGPVEPKCHMQCHLYSQQEHLRRYINNQALHV